MRGNVRLNILNIFIVLFIIVLSLNVEAEDFNTRRELWLETEVTIPIHFVKESSNAKLQSLDINYSWIPTTDYRQKLLDIESSPFGIVSDSVLEIRRDILADFDMKVRFESYGSSNALQVKTKVDFPLKNLDSSLNEYVLPYDKIDINEDIRNKAIELAAGEDDLYVVVFKLADWTNTNINYTLSSTTLDASLPSSWVFENKQGVCDEISNLFISMCRSLGIPARFVSGISYTNDPQFQNSWGPHGWAEVYFPGYGWVPFDPTYNQLGYVDATHIKFIDGGQNDKSALNYAWIGNDVGVSSGKIKIAGLVTKSGELSNADIVIDVDFMKEFASFNSYNVVRAKIKNEKDYYVAKEISISRVEGIDVLSPERQEILLFPNEEKTIYWIIKINNLNPDYIYTFPVTIYSANYKSTANIQAEKLGQKISLLAAQNYALSQQVDVQTLKFNCNVSSNVIYVNQRVNIECFNDVKKYLKICVEDVCSSESFLSTKRSFILNTSGFTTIRIMAIDTTTNDVAYSFLSFNVLDEAKIDLDVKAPSSLEFNDVGEISLILNKQSSSLPKNVEINIVSKSLSQEWNLTKLDSKQELVLEFVGKNLKNGENEILIEINYVDELGKKYSESKNIVIELKNLTFIQKIYVWMNGFMS
ncbi:MAG: transglutaminase-like domain-containing protein [Candidatus Woesearchaeota archaeon]|jgi:transglutaminase-like putative cysteine protease